MPNLNPSMFAKTITTKVLDIGASSDCMFKTGHIQVIKKPRSDDVNQAFSFKFTIPKCSSAVQHSKYWSMGRFAGFTVAALPSLLSFFPENFVNIHQILTIKV